MLAFLEVAPAAVEVVTKLDEIIRKLFELSLGAGKHIIIATLVFIVGRFLVGILNRLFNKMLERRKIDLTVKTFLRSLVNILLTVLLIITVVSALGINTTSFAALLASAGVAVGMALSGNLSNFAGGIIVLIFKPYAVGDWIETQDVQGTVKEIQIFHTLLTTADNKVIYVPNGSMSTSVITNYSKQDKRRVEWLIGVDYGSDIAKVRNTLLTILAKEARILAEPAPFVALKELADSSINFTVRVWAKKEDYWGVYHDVLSDIYTTFNAEGIDFPFPQQTIHIAKD